MSLLVIKISQNMNMQLDTSPWRFSIQMPVGWLQVVGNQYFVTSAQFVFESPEEDFGGGSLKDKAYEQLQSYRDKPDQDFDLPVVTSGSDFQQRVWAALETIPLGETWTYGQLAKVVSSSARAVGGACRTNPVVVLIPCHRVVSASGIGGYAGNTEGDNLDVKQWLLMHEAKRH